MEESGGPSPAGPGRGPLIATVAGVILMAAAGVGLVLALHHSSSSTTALQVVGGGAPPAGSSAPLATPPPLPATPPVSAKGEHQAGDPASFYLRATSQPSDGRTVSVEEVVASGHPGWIAVHADAGGGPGAIIGVSALLPAGRSVNVPVTLSQPLSSTAIVFPMLHLEDNGDTTFDFPAADQPPTLSGKLVDVPIEIDVAGGS